MTVAADQSKLKDTTKDSPRKCDAESESVRREKGCGLNQTNKWCE